MNNFDCGIIGAGMAGAFATLRIAKNHRNAKIIVFDIGRPPQKRRRQLEGWLGCLPNSDGKLYLNDLNKISQVVGSRKTKMSYNWFNKIALDDFKVIKDRSIFSSTEKKFKKAGFEVQLNDYIQLYPKDIHLLSKQMSEQLEDNTNITFKFDNEVISVRKQKNMFAIQTEEGDFLCKKLIISTGRSGWRWTSQLFSNLGIVENNDIARFGVRVEISTSIMKEFNKSNCHIIRDDLELGPFSWYGTVIPEDHLDLAISAFRSNENRWKSDKVSFNLIGNRHFPNYGFEQTDRMGKLIFVLSNDRIVRERLATIITGKSKISVIKEYDWMKSALAELNEIIPEVISKGYFHVPTIIPMAPKINLGNNLVSEVDGMFAAGESAGFRGLLAAACSGIIAADGACK